jgi:2,6-dihydroxypyridine 3-monooxygenase
VTGAPPLRVAVVGGSLGGLTAALFLRDAGCDVFERSPRPLEGRGAGIVLHPATVRYVVERTDHDIASISAKATRLRYLEVGGTAHEQPCRYRFTSYGALHRVLMASFGESRYQRGAEVTGFVQDARGVTARVAGGSEIRCDLLVCADGIHSSSRRALLPEVEPVYAGYAGWRGAVHERYLSARSYEALAEAITYSVIPHSHILSYPIPGPRGSVGPGERSINWVWYRNVDGGRDLADLLTDRNGTRRDVSLGPGQVRDEHLAALRAAAEELPAPLAELVCRTAEPFVQAVFDVSVPRMAFARACLIGDAAFALRPHVAAGTAKAADDGYRLARALAACGGDVAAALRAWEPQRLALGRSAVDRARRAGERSQFEGTWKVGDPLPFGLYEDGDSELD